MLRTLYLLLLLLPLLSVSSHALTVQDSEENEYDVEVMPADGELLALWITDLVEEERPHLKALMGSLQQSGIEVWSTRILQDLFLTRDDPTIMDLDGSAIAALIEAAHQHSNKKILLLSYDKISIPFLRGIRHWQQHYPNRDRIAGTALFYPNLFIAPQRAGDDPSPAPILSMTNIPLTIFQPQQGQHAKRISTVMEALWEAGSAATLSPLAGIRDWYIMHKPGKYPAEAPVRARLPQQLKQIARQSHFSPFPESALAGKKATAPHTEEDPYRLIPIQEKPTAPNFTLSDLSDKPYRLNALKGKVVLVNFWASWCPPCIEEMPSMNQIYQHYHPRGLELLGINFQEDPEQITEFLKQVKVDFPVLFDHDGAVAQQWNVFSMPTSFLVDRSGKVRYAVSRSIHWDLPEHTVVIERLLAEQ